MKKLCVLACALLGAAMGLNGQVAGRVTGSVLDVSGSGVPGATVSLQLPGSGSNVYTTTTSPSGDFTILTVNPATYDLAVEAKGFIKKVVANLKVDSNRSTDVPQIKLEVSAVTTTVEVSASQLSVDTSSAVVSTSIARSQIQNLPTMNRSPLAFLQTQAGINNARGNTTVNGQRSTYVNVTVDGINVQDNFIRTNDVDFLPNMLLLDQVAEVTVVSSNASASSMGGSAQIQFVTPSGTNSFHGSGYWSNRNNYFAANTWFGNQAGTARPFLNQNQVGGSLGGRIIKNKTFFYTNYEAFRLKQQTAQNHTVLTPDARNGIFTYLVGGAPQKLNILQAAGLSVDPQVANILKNVPSIINNYNVGDSTGSVLRNTAGYLFNKRNNRTRDNVTIKGDHMLSTRNQFTVTHTWNRDILDRPDQDPSYSLVPNVANDSGVRLLSAAWRSSPKANFTNEARFGFNWAPAPFLASGEVPEYFVGGTVFTNPTNPFRTQGRNTDTYNFSDNAHWVHGAHTVSFGFQSQVLRIEQYNDAGITPTYSLGIGTGNTGLATAQLPGGSSADLTSANNLLATLAGYITSATQTFNAADRTSGFAKGAGNVRHNRFDNYALYAEDAWRVRRNLTLTLGLRWDYYTPVDERDSLALLPVLKNNNVISTLLDPNSTLDFAGASIGKPWYKSDRNNFAPNIGLAWDPTGEGKWSIRSGYALAYVNDNTLRAVDNSQGTNAGLQQGVTRSGLSGRLGAGVPAIAAPAFKVPRSLADNYALNSQAAAAMPSPDMVTPYVQQWHLSVQRSVKNWLIDARYVGNHSTKSMRGFDYNQVIISQLLPDFLKARNNGFLAQAAGGSFNPAYNANIPGSQPIPFFSQLGSGGLLTNATIIGHLQTGSVGELASTYQINALNGSVNFFANPNILGANALTNYSNATYNAFQLDVTHRFSSGMQFQGNYVFSKVMSDAGGEQQTNFEPFLDINNGKIEKSRVSGSDLTHVLKFNGLYELPFGIGKRFNPGSRVLSRIVSGWNIAGIVTEQSGSPFSVTSTRGTLNRAGRSGNNTASTTLNKAALDQIFRLEMTGNGPFFVPQSVRGADGRAVAADGAAPFNGQVFFNPGPGTLGVLQRNYFSGPWIFNMDAKVSKMTQIREGHTLELRMDSTNIFNKPTWFVGDQSINSTTFGKITGTFFGRRLVQFALYYRF